LGQQRRREDQEAYHEWKQGLKKLTTAHWSLQNIFRIRENVSFGAQPKPHEIFDKLKIKKSKACPVMGRRIHTKALEH
jgi:hypothetical protein